MALEHSLERITYINNGKKEQLQVADLIWAFYHQNGLYLISKEHHIYVFEINKDKVDSIYEALQKSNPSIYTGALKGHRIGLRSLPNTRDYGGMQTTDGRFILPKKLIRSGELHKASKEDKKTLLDEYGLKTIVDLRSEAERLLQPDPIMLPVMHYDDTARELSELDLLQHDLKTKGITGTLFEAKELMEKLYEDLVVSKQGINCYKKLFRILLDHEEGAFLWHCTQGKDRTGIGAMLILSALGVSKEDIYKDYEQSSLYLKGQKEDLLLKCEKHPEWKEGVDAWCEAKKKYLDIAYENIKDAYGNVDRYLKEALELSQEDITTLQDRLLV